MRMNLPTRATIPEILASTSTLPTYAPQPVPQWARGPGAVPGGAPTPQTTASPAFVWGGGGAMLTPEELALRRQQAQAMEAAGMDFSPVGSWTQGAARVLQGLVGGLEERKLNKQSAAQRGYSNEVAAALANGGDNAVAAALADPRVDPGVKELAKLRFQADHKTPPALPEVVQLSQIANDPTLPQSARDAAAAHLKVMNDPMMSTTLPGNNGSYNGPVSGFAPAVQALGIPTTVASQAPPAEAIAELRADPSGAAEFDQVFGAGAAARYLSQGGPASAPGGFPR